MAQVKHLHALRPGGLGGFFHLALHSFNSKSETAFGDRLMKVHFHNARVTWSPTNFVKNICEFGRRFRSPKFEQDKMSYDTSTYFLELATLA